MLELILKSPASFFYEGEVKGGEFHGYGFKVDLAEALFLGSFEHNQRHGFGYEIDANLGNIFVGSYVEGVRHGKGEFYFMDKRMQYVGDINHGR